MVGYYSSVTGIMPGKNLDAIGRQKAYIMEASYLSEFIFK